MNAPRRQQINLYSSELLPRSELLTLSRLLIACAATLALCLLLGGLDLRQAQRAEAALAEAQNQLALHKAAVDSARLKLQTHLPSPTLVSELNQQQAEEAAKSGLLAAIAKGSPVPAPGYSPVLLRLASYPVEGLWLTTISLKGNDIVLTGLTREAERVPRLVEALGRDNRFNADGYESLELSRATGPDEGLLQFVLRSKSASGDPP